MPWRELTPVSQRKDFVYLAKQGRVSFSELCRRFEISRPTGYKWLERELKGEPLADRSRKPRSNPRKTPQPIEDTIISMRTKYPAWGGRKIYHRLTKLGYVDLPQPSTITDILRRNGLIHPDESIKHKAFQRFEMELPNQLWQMDFKGYFGLPEGGYCHPLTVIDDHSRFLLGLEACVNQRKETVQDRLTTIFRQYGLPDRMLMDNGSPWGDSGESHHTVFTAWLVRLDIKVSHGRPYHPQTQGKDERLHRTLKDELLTRKSLANLVVCQKEFDDWRKIYNYERPHESLKMETPSFCYSVSTKPFPEQLPPIVYDTDFIVRKVDATGRIYFHNRDFRVGKAFRHNPVGLKPAEIDGTFDVYFCNQVVAQIDLTV